MEEEFLGVYREIAASAIQNWELYDKDPEEARKEARAMAENSSIDDLENGHVWGSGSITAAIESLVRQLGVDVNPKTIVDDIYKDNDSSLTSLAGNAKAVQNINAMILKALSDIHDRWCIDNAGKFFEAGRNKQYQHLPLELIGWKEAKADLLFLNPMLKQLGIDFDIDSLQKDYESMQRRFLQEKGITSQDMLRDYISKGEYLESLSNRPEVDDSTRKTLNRSVDTLRNNGEVITDAKRDEKYSVIWRKDENGNKIKDENGDRVPEQELARNNVQEAILAQHVKRKVEINYPSAVFGLREVKEGANKNQNQDV